MCRERTVLRVSVRHPDGDLESSVSSAILLAVPLTVTKVER